MPIYQYSGLNADGQLERGMMPGASMDAVTRRLQAKGIEIQELSVAEGSDDPLHESTRTEFKNERGRFQTDVIGPVANTVPLQQLQFFFMQLGTMMGAGIGMSHALGTLSGQTQSPVLRNILNESKEMVANGEPLSACFQRYPEVFTPLLVSMIRAGEEGGFLTDQCTRMSEYLQHEIELRNIIKKETLYPKITIVSSIFIILAANWVIGSYGHEGAAKIYSPLTQASTWVIITPIIVGLFVYFRIVKRQPRAQYQWDTMAVKVPGIGKLVHGFAMAKFGRSFGALYSSGVPLPKSVKLSADACGNEYVRSQIYPAADALETGRGITECFAETGAFSPIVLDMTSTGEMTGNVDEMLHKMAEFYEEEGKIKARQVAVVVGVAVFLLTAIYIAYVVVTFYSGIGSTYMDQM